MTPVSIMIWHKVVHMGNLRSLCISLYISVFTIRLCNLIWKGEEGGTRERRAHLWSEGIHLGMQLSIKEEEKWENPIENIPHHNHHHSCLGYHRPYDWSNLNGGGNMSLSSRRWQFGKNQGGFNLNLAKIKEGVTLCQSPICSRVNRWHRKSAPTKFSSHKEEKCPLLFVKNFVIWKMLIKCSLPNSTVKRSKDGNFEKNTFEPVTKLFISILVETRWWDGSISGGKNNPNQKVYLYKLQYVKHPKSKTLTKTRKLLSLYIYLNVFISDFSDFRMAWYRTELSDTDNW